MKRLTQGFWFAMVLFIFAVSSHAELKLIGTGATMKADITAFPQNIKDSYPLFEKKCIKCHGLDRTLLTLQSGIAPSGAVFDNSSVDAYGAKMLRKPDSDMTKQDVRIVLGVVRFMLEEAAK